MSTFGLSFIVIGAFWLSHHSSFQYIGAFDRVFLRLNMLFLLCIAFMPFPTEVLGSHGSSSAVVLYAGTVAVTGTVSGAMWWYASHRRRLLTDLASHELILRIRLQRIAAPAVFALSVPVAYASPALAKYAWVLVYPASRIARRPARRRVASRP